MGESPPTDGVVEYGSVIEVGTRRLLELVHETSTGLDPPGASLIGQLFKYSAHPKESILLDLDFGLPHLLNLDSQLASGALVHQELLAGGVVPE